MELLVVIVFMVAFFAAIVLLGRWLLGPIDRAARARQAPVRYSLADFLCLFVIIQIPLAAVYQFTDEETRPFYWFLTAVTWVAGPIIWFTATRALSKAAIGGIHRLAFMGLIVPLAYYGLMPFVVITMMLAGAVFGDGPENLRDFWIVAIWLALGGALLFGGLYTRWMVRQVNEEREGRVIEGALSQVS